MLSTGVTHLKGSLTPSLASVIQSTMNLLPFLVRTKFRQALPHFLVFDWFIRIDQKRYAHYLPECDATYAALRPLATWTFSKSTDAEVERCNINPPKRVAFSERRYGHGVGPLIGVDMRKFSRMMAVASGSFTGWMNLGRQTMLLETSLAARRPGVTIRS